MADEHPECRATLPHSARLYAVAFESAQLARRVGRLDPSATLGLDFATIKAAPRQLTTTAPHEYAQLSDAAVLEPPLDARQRWPRTRGTGRVWSGAGVAKIANDSRCDGVLVWAQVDFGKGGTVSSEPSANALWPTHLFFAPEPFDARAGDTLLLDARVDADGQLALDFHIHKPQATPHLRPPPPETPDLPDCRATTIES